MKEIMKSQMGYTMLMTILIAFIFIPTSKVWSVGIVPVKEPNSTALQSSKTSNDIKPDNEHTDKNKDVPQKDQKLSKKEKRKLLKAQEPNLLPETNLEWFFLLVSGVGLFIAILGGLGGFGWLIFAGGLITYLFYKLLRN